MPVVCSQHCGRRVFDVAAAVAGCLGDCAWQARRRDRCAICVWARAGTGGTCEQRRLCGVPPRTRGEVGENDRPGPGDQLPVQAGRQGLAGFPCPVRGGPKRDEMTAEQLQLDEWARGRCRLSLDTGGRGLLNPTAEGDEIDGQIEAPDVRAAAGVLYGSGASGGATAETPVAAASGLGSPAAADAKPPGHSEDAGAVA